VARDDPDLFVRRAARRGGLPKYRPLAEIARGATSVVYLAAAQEPGRPRLVAIKMLREELLHYPAAIEMFDEQALIAAKLDHPNLVKTLEVGRNGLRPFQAMEFVDGQPLSRILQRAQGRGLSTPLPLVLRVVTDVLAALDYAHELAGAGGAPLRLVHREIGLRNIVVTYDGVIKLLGFGAAKAADKNSPARDDQTRGMDAYLAPECLYGLPVDRRADIFGAGAVLWQGIVTTLNAEGRLTASGIVTDPRSVAFNRKDVDPELARIVERAMSGDPAARYPTAREMREEMEQYVRQSNLVLPDAAALGAFVAPLFVEDRERQQAIIEVQQQRLLAATPEPAPSAPLPRYTTTTPPPPAVSSTTPRPPPLSSDTRRVAPPTAEGSHSVASAPPVPEPVRDRGRAVALIAVACVAVPVAASVVAAWRRPSRTSATATTTPVAATETIALDDDEVARTTPPPVPSVPGSASSQPTSRARSSTLAQPSRAAASAPRVIPAPADAHPSTAGEPLASQVSPATLPVQVSAQVPAVDTPPAGVRVPKVSAIDTPPPKPVRDIFKEDPYLK
jgi:eukaryotic-like serine/threonine-protein kinase